MPADTVVQLHEVAASLKAQHAERQVWFSSFGEGAAYKDLQVSQSEAEMIFAARIAADENRLKELGWSRVVKVETNPIAQPRALNGEQS